MKKVLIVLVAVLLVFGLTGCASMKQDAPPPAPEKKVVLGADGIPQPDWVYKTVSSQDMHYESGYGMMSNKQNSIKRATVEAKNKIAAWVSTSVKEVVVTYVNDAGSGDNRQALDAMETISQQVAEATLSGVSTEEMWVDAEGGVWVLCSIPLANIEQSFEPAAEAVAEAFVESDAAAAANAKMKDAFANLLKKAN
ncbi:MAG: LPP20 family lipoprotein [Sphaerochaeta sp.]|nr:LPP20 family lipoprotein [Sphaerochaeta sp.]